MVGHEGSHFLKLLPPLPRLHQVREIAQALTGGDGMVCLYPLKHSQNIDMYDLDVQPHCGLLTHLIHPFPSHWYL